MIKENWKTLLLALGFLLSAAITFVFFIDAHEAATRGKGWIFDDPVHAVLPAMNLSIPIFSITYGSLILYVFTSYRQPNFLSRLMIAYGLITLFRIGTISLFPLREPETLVFLEDPVLNDLIYPGEIITDLFFSGHTALVFMLFILSGYRWYFLLLTLLMGVFLMIQRIHYSIDVLAALPFAWLAVWLAGKFLERISKSNNT
jgi:hypothetical protein